MSRLRNLFLFSLALAIPLSCGTNPAQASLPAYAHPAHPYGASVGIELIGSGGVLPMFGHRGTAYVAGAEGERYALRLRNHTNRRVEVVVTVDGRDVVSGELGDYRKQRGYVLDPYGEVDIEGFRRSFDHVAAFRFSHASDAYSTHRGSPEHVGVIGVAVFEEKLRRAARRRPVAPTPWPTTRYHDDEYSGRSADAPAGAAPAERKRDASGEGRVQSESAAKSSTRGYGGGDRFAPSPAPRQELGTAWGETDWSPVREVEFKRKHRSKPDEVFAVYYDTLEGLRARGVAVGGWYETPEYEDEDPQPFPENRRFARPPYVRYR